MSQWPVMWTLHPVTTWPDSLLCGQRPSEGTALHVTSVPEVLVSLPQGHTLGPPGPPLPGGQLPSGKSPPCHVLLTTHSPLDEEGQACPLGLAFSLTSTPIRHSHSGSSCCWTVLPGHLSTAASLLMAASRSTPQTHR